MSVVPAGPGMAPLWASSEEDDVEDMDDIEGMSTSQLSTLFLAPAPPLSPQPIVHISLAGCVCMSSPNLVLLVMSVLFIICKLLSCQAVCERLSDWR